MNDSSSDKEARSDLPELEKSIQECLSQGFRFLLFPRPIEELFLSDTNETRRKRIFTMAVFAVFIYNLFLVTDREMLPDVYQTAWLIRLAIVTPMLLTGLILLKVPFFSRFPDYIADILLLSSSASIIFILELSSHPNVAHYHTGIILIVMFGNIVVRLRFWHAFAVSWITFLLYIMTVTRIEPMPEPVMINSSVVLFSAVIISLIANYQMEYDLRVNYLRERLKEIARIRLEKSRDELEHLSTSDELTGLANRRSFDARLAKEWAMASDYRLPLSLLFLDVDDFKAYNDHYGHQAGDECLRSIAAVIGNRVRRSVDLCARYGGEEFVVLLPNTSLQNAISIAENIRTAVEKAEITHEYSRVGPQVTISIGVASVVPEEGFDRNILVERADKALYQAKETGRNRTCRESV